MFLNYLHFYLCIRLSECCISLLHPHTLFLLKVSFASLIANLVEKCKVHYQRFGRFTAAHQAGWYPT